MKIALAQFRPEFGESDRNIERLLRLCKENPARSVYLPELCVYGLPVCEPGRGSCSRRSVHSRRIEAFRNAAKELDACLIFGFPELAGAVIYNSALAVLSDGREYLYRKTHLFTR